MKPVIHAGQAREVKWIVIACLVAGAYWSGGHSKVQLVSKNVRAERFELVDKDGNVRAVLGMGLDDSKSNVQSANGSQHVSLQSPALALFDAKRQPRIVLNVGLDGFPGMTLVDENGRPYATLSNGFGKHGSLKLWDMHGRPKAELSVAESGDASIILRNGKKRTRMITP